SRVKEEDLITDVENAVFDLGVMKPLGQSLHASRPSRLCAQAQSVNDMSSHCGPIESKVKHLLGGVVWAMISLSGSIVASLENVNGFLTVNTPLDDLIRTDFEQNGVVLKEENPSEQSRLKIFLSKEIFKGRVIRIHNVFVRDEDHTYGKVACIAHKLKGDSDFLLEEVDAFLALKDDPTSLEVDQSYFDTEGDIILLEAFLNDDPSLPPPNQGNYFPQVRKELKICKAKTDKSSIDEPPEVELKDLPLHLEYEKTALRTVMKSHKRAIAWKLSDIKGINP
nr:reverse transcriptase domain-containing protein [Tanacetum cinerariifolium]